MGSWATGRLLALDLETTGVDRFTDVPVSYALVSVERGIVGHSWTGIIDPGRDIPVDAVAVHGISTARAREGMPLRVAIDLLTDAVVRAGGQGVPVVGMRLDYDLTMLEVQALRLGLPGIVERGWCGPVVDAAVLDRLSDGARIGKRTLADLCSHYGVDLVHAHDAFADALASVEVAVAIAAGEPSLWDCDLDWLHAAQESWHREAVGGNVGQPSELASATGRRDPEWPVAARWSRAA
jgi:DNA polymerase III subunit epsilon